MLPSFCARDSHEVHHVSTTELPRIEERQCVAAAAPHDFGLVRPRLPERRPPGLPVGVQHGEDMTICLLLAERRLLLLQLDVVTGHIVTLNRQLLDRVEDHLAMHFEGEV